MKIETYRPELLPAVVRFWNRCFSGRRNSFPVTDQIFLRRVVEKRTAVERFEPDRFIAAVDGEEIVGLVHAGVRVEEICRSLDADWPGGSQGVVYLIQVDPARTREGLGTQLWHRALESLRDTRQVVLDGQCLNPFYGNSEGPFTPFWGTPEGIAVDWKDSATQKFLARKGFAPRFKGVQLALDIAGSEAPPLEASERSIEKLGFRFHYDGGRLLEVGNPMDGGRPMLDGLEFECLAVVRDDVVVGALVYYPLKEVAPGLFAIYEAKVAEPYRGKAMGKHLLAAASARMRARGARSCEVLTIPDLSPAALKAYERAGFQPAAKWAIY